MADKDKINPQLINELTELRQQIAELEVAEIEHKRVEETLRHSKKEWEGTFNAISDWVSLLDLKGRILRTKTVGEKWLGLSVAEIIGQNCCKLVHSKEEPIPECSVQRMLHTHQRETVELQIPGTKFWWLVTADPLFDEEDTLGIGRRGNRCPD
jgi:PAS domain S-box-containing protein